MALFLRVEMQIWKFLWFILIMLMSFSIVHSNCKNANVGATKICNISHLRDSTNDVVYLLKNMQVVSMLWPQISIQPDFEQSSACSLGTQNSTDFKAFETSTTGESLLPLMLRNITFKGLTGDLHMTNGQLQQSSFEIQNVNVNVIWFGDYCSSRSKWRAGESIKDYNTLVDQIHIRHYVSWVGDSDPAFTFPYTEPGVAAIVPNMLSESKNAWIFLKPLTTGLWLTIGAFFVFTGMVVWVLEHRVNKAFQGPPLQQIGIVFWFSFSTLVFAHREKITSNLTRFVMIVWVFVVLVLASSYTATLASMLTERHLQPTVNDVHDLIKNGEYIGYQDGSFVGQLLNNMKFNSSKFRNYTSVEEYDEALSKGSRNGGVAAVVDELPYIRLFLAKYCHKYTMTGPTYLTSGFGFIFPKGSPLVADVSRAILKVRKGEEMVRISRKWFTAEGCGASDGDGTMTASESLDVDTFKGLFLIAGLSATSALAVFSSIFLYENRDVLTSSASLKQKIYMLCRVFYQEEDGITSSKESSSGDIQGEERDESLAICIACDQQMKSP